MSQGMYHAERKKSLSYIRAHFEGVKRDLMDLSRVPSINFPSYKKRPVMEAAEGVKRLLKGCSVLRRVCLIRLAGRQGWVAPYVYGESHQEKGRPTVLLYGHYDVQPPMREALWRTGAFVPTERGGRLYGRGTADDKAGIMVHVGALRALGAGLGKEKPLPCNIKVLIEGEEEIGSPNIEGLLKQEAERLRSDAMVVVDTANVETGIGSLTASLRGIIVLEVELRSMKQPLHSGNWGGILPDPVMGMAKILSSLVDDEGQINLPGIKNDLKKGSQKKEKAYTSLKMSEALVRRQVGLLSGVKVFGGRSKASLLRNVWLRPALVINALETGGRLQAGNVLMDAAWARIGLRTAGWMKAKHVSGVLQRRLRAVCPWGLQVVLREESCCDGWQMQAGDPYKQRMMDALSRGYGGKVCEIGSGATIPFVSSVAQNMQGTSLLLMGIGDPYTNAHGENESIHLGDLKKSLLSEVHFLYDLGATYRFRVK